MSLFSDAKSAEDVLLRLSALFGDRMIPGETMIFFDEVQECRKLITQIKYLAVPNTDLPNWTAADLCKDGKLNAFDLCLMKRKLING